MILSLVARRCYNKPVQGINSVDVWQNRIIVFGALRWRWQFPEQDSQTPTEGFVMSKEIPLSSNGVTLVSDEDYEYLKGWNWFPSTNGYAQRNQRTGGRRRLNIFLHRVVVERMLGGPIPEGCQVDHIDRDKRNNQRENLRIATISQNAHNRNSKRDSLSQHKGVSWHKHKKRWIASIKLQGKSYHLGYFDTEREAAEAYDHKARELFGEHASTNFTKGTRTTE